MKRQQMDQVDSDPDATHDNQNTQEEDDGFIDPRKEKRKIKKLRKIQMKKPGFKLNEDNLLMVKHNYLKLKDWQNMVLWLMADGINPSWMMVVNKAAVRKLVVLMVPQLAPGLILPAYREHARTGRGYPAPSQPRVDGSGKGFERFPLAIVTEGPSDKLCLKSAVNYFLSTPLTQAQKAAIKHQRAKDSASFELSQLVMTAEELTLNQYPTLKDQPQWTNHREHNNDQHYEYLAMDCEMCITSFGLEVTRISLVDFDLKVVYDTLLKPERPITDYNTKYSGITFEMMKDVTKTLPDVHRELARFIGSKTVLIGHSLENDLNCLQIVHDKVIDTAIIYHSTRGPPHKPSLRYLAQTHLQLRIQENEHDPIEDARTCMRLVQMKLEKGRYFGLTISETESLFTRIGRNGKRSAIIDTKYGLNTAWPVDSQITCENDGEIAEAVEIGMADCDFVWSRVRSLESAAQNDSSVAVTPANMQARVSELNEIVEKVWQALPDGAVLIVVSAHGDTRDASRLMKERNEYQRRCAQENVLELHQNHPELVFGPEKMDELERAVSYGVIGVGMIATKQ